MLVTKKIFLHAQVRLTAPVEDIEELLKCLSHDLAKTKHQKVFRDLDSKNLSNGADSNLCFLTG